MNLVILGILILLLIYAHQIENYQNYEKQLSKTIKNPKKLNILVEEYYMAFIDGVRYGRGNLKVEI
jgi:hypothetical protein